ncbi:MAG: DNA adenine methylase [Terriglobia bacterium]
MPETCQLPLFSKAQCDEFAHSTKGHIPLRGRLTDEPVTGQLLKWIGNKQRFAHQIAAFLGSNFGTYFDPFLGSGSVLATMAPRRGIASDSFKPLVEIWVALKNAPQALNEWYLERYKFFKSGTKIEQYEKIKASYNKRPNGADLLFLSRSCYGGVVRFRQSDGYMSTPCGVHDPIPPAKFGARVSAWHPRVMGTEFLCTEFEDAMTQAKRGDLIYCDPPYSYSQSILYGAQGFSFERLIEVIEKCKCRGVDVALSIDGTKKSGSVNCHLAIPKELFKREVTVNCGRSMLRRFQMKEHTLEDEVVTDRLLLTF